MKIINLKHFRFTKRTNRYQSNILFCGYSTPKYNTQAAGNINFLNYYTQPFARHLAGPENRCKLKPRGNQQYHYLIMWTKLCNKRLFYIACIDIKLKNVVLVYLCIFRS